MEIDKKRVDKKTVIQQRSQFLKKARDFFEKRNILEVDCPHLSQFASVDANIDLIPCLVSGNETRYLHSSPEYAMKRLLAEGVGDIYQLTHVFRDSECGKKHNPEFTMAEWYRIGISFDEMMHETCDFIRLFVGDLPCEILTYKEAFLRHTGMNPFTATFTDLAQYLENSAVNVVIDPQNDTKDDLLNFILALDVEPALGTKLLTVLAYFPPTQAALAKTRILDHDLVAERFEVYYKGYELANGYHELRDYQEQLKRLEKENATRKRLGKNELPIDLRFIEALKKGFPDSCGVAVGFDRLVMLALNKEKIGDILPFDWEHA